jgi:hypothetical protein
MNLYLKSEHFFAKVDKNGPRMPHMQTKCHVWVGATSAGYGVINLKKGDGSGWQMEYAHRISFFISDGEIPRYVLHHCDNKLCIRRSHIYAGNQSLNGLDSYRRGRREPVRKLTVEQVRHIRRLREKGNTFQSIADRFGCEESNIRAIIAGRSWKSVVA